MNPWVLVHLASAVIAIENLGAAPVTLTICIIVNAFYAIRLLIEDDIV